MEQFMNGTSAVHVCSTKAGSWNLYKCRYIDDAMLSYTLQMQDVENCQMAMVQVINRLLHHMQVGLLAACSETDEAALSLLAGHYPDGRMLKCSTRCAFVALDNCFEGLEGIADTMGFRLAGFDAQASSDAVFRTLLEQDGLQDARLEISCRHFAEGILYIRLNAEKTDEAEMIGMISDAIHECGGLLQVNQ